MREVDWVVQYDVGEEVDDYVHRVGRCGRMGQEGSAVLFLTEREMPYLTLFPSLTFQPLPLAPILSSLRFSPHPTPTALSSPPAGALLQRLIESIVSGHRELYSLAVSAYQSYVARVCGVLEAGEGGHRGCEWTAPGSCVSELRAGGGADEGGKDEGRQGGGGRGAQIAEQAREGSGGSGGECRGARRGGGRSA